MSGLGVQGVLMTEESIRLDPDGGGGATDEDLACLVGVCGGI